MKLSLNKTFFVKRYLYTTVEEHNSKIKYDVLRFANNSIYNELNLSYTELMSLPMFLIDEFYDTYKSMADSKRNTVKHL